MTGKPYGCAQMHMRADEQVGGGKEEEEEEEEKEEQEGVTMHANHCKTKN